MKEKIGHDMIDLGIDTMNSEIIDSKDPMKRLDSIKGCTRQHGSHISLETHLRIAHQSTEALAYLHTSAYPPIFHGDVKSANIL
jgi:serine/threonine protein kinase